MGDGIETTRTVEADGVRVGKTIDTGSDGTGVVTLAVTLEREAPTTVRITEPALGSIPRDCIELHTDHGAEHWRIGDDATFERSFEPGESYQVVYRVAGVDPDRLDDLDADPVVETAGEPMDDLVDREDSEAIRELIRGERASLATAPGAGGVELSTEPEEGDPADVPADGASPEEATAGGSPEEISVDVPSVDASPESTASDAEGSEEAAEEASADGLQADEVPSDGPPSDDPPAAGLGASLAATPKGGLARVLLQELREGHVDEETRDALRSELEPGRSQEVRIRHLQNEVAEFSAYVEMLDRVVDEHGPFDDVFDELQDGVGEEVATLGDEVESVRSELDGLSEAVDDADALATDVDDLRAGQEDLRTGQDDLQAGQDDLESRVDRLEDQLATVDDRLDELDEFKERISGVFQDAGDADS